MRVGEAIQAFKALGGAKIAALSDEDAMRVLTARKELRAVCDGFDAFLKDAQEGAKPVDYEAVVAAARGGGAERAGAEAVIAEYQQRVTRLVQNELEKVCEAKVSLWDEAAWLRIVRGGCAEARLEDVEPMKE